MAHSVRGDLAVHRSLRFPGITTTQRDAMTVVPVDTIIKNNTTTQLERWDGTSWRVFGETGRVHADDTTVAPAAAGAPTVAELQTFATAASLAGVLLYYTGDDLPATAPSYVADVDGAGVVTLIETPAAMTGTFTHPFLIADWSNNSLSNLGNLAPSTSGTINAQSVERFQSFTSTATGDINILDLNLANIGAGGTQTARIRIYDGAGIGGTVLAETTVVVTGSTETTFRATFPSAAPVTTGNVFTVGVVRTGTNVPSNSLGWHVTPTDIFPGHTVSNGLLGATDGKMVFDIVPSGASGGSLPIPAATHGLGVGYHHVTVFDTANDTVLIQGNVDPLTGDVTLNTDGALFDGSAYIS